MNLNIGQKLRAGFSILLILMGVISISSYIALVDMRSATDLVHSRVSALASMDHLRQKMEEALSSNAFAITGDVEEKTTFDLKIKSMEDIFNATVQYDLGVKGPLLNTVRIQYRDIQEKTNLLYKIAEEEGKGFDDSRVEELVEQIENTQISMLEDLSIIVMFLKNSITLAVSRADETKVHGLIVTSSISAIAIIFSMVAAYLLTQDISRMTETLHNTLVSLEDSNRELSDFAQIASHDLQEPLRKVTSFGQRLQQKFGDQLSEQGNDYLNRMQSATVRMQALINGLLSYSRVSTQAKPFEPVDLAKVVKEGLTDLEIRIEETNGTVEVSDLPTIDAEPLQMRQLFQNLIGNALKFNKPGRPPIVKVSSMLFREEINRFNATEGKELCQFMVEDNGVGFDEKYVDRIFGVFQRLHSRSEYEGTGIGLSVCKKIVERHGGTISASSPPGKGATFKISLPTKQQHKVDKEHGA